MDFTKCFVCDDSCVAISKNIGTNIADSLNMPLAYILTKCLRTVVEVENEHFCFNCIRRIEEYDRLAQLSLQIENLLFKQFQSKPFIMEVAEITVHQSAINELLIDSSIVKVEENTIERSTDEIDLEDEQKPLLADDQVSVNSNDQNENNEGQKVEIVRNIKVKQIVKTRKKKAPKKKSTAQTEAEQVTCDICGRLYKSKGALGVHMVKHSKQNPNECKICNKVFTQRGGLTRHMPLHTGEYQHQCDICGKRFIHSASFNMHKKIHFNVRTKKCTICGSEFHSSSHMTRHMRSHTGEKPFSCSICNQKFTQRYNLKTHYKTHEKVQDLKNFKCLICPESFYRREKLKEHLAQVHEAAIDAALPASNPD